MSEVPLYSPMKCSAAQAKARAWMSRRGPGPEIWPYSPRLKSQKGGVFLRVVHLGRSACHAASGRRD